MTDKSQGVVTPINVLIVIVNYQMAKECIRLIQSVLAGSHDEIRRIVCADNSCEISQWNQLLDFQTELQKGSNGTKPLVELILIKNTKNRGFGAAINEAIQQQNFSGFSFDKLLLINPDVYLSAYSLENLFKGVSQSPAAGIWGGVTVDDKGIPDGYHAWREPTILRELAWSSLLSKLIPSKVLVNDYRVTHQQSQQLISYTVDAVSGCFILVGKELWSQLRGFDERFFLYSEEIDLCKRARQLGFQPQVINQATIQHSRGTTNDTTNRIGIVINSKLLYWKKHHSTISQSLVRIIYAFGYFWRGLLFFFLPQKKHLAKVWLKISAKLLLNKPLLTK